MSMDLLRLGLQFFAGETKEEEEEVIIPGGEGLTGASGVTGSTPPAYTMPENLVSAPVAQDFDTWYKTNGGMDEAGYYAKYDLDPDRDYQNTVNTLNYEYQTSMATYGEQAEKMYQMGLQNSGVSDIFQANAFSSYLGNMNQAAADRITARKRNKAAFNDYVAGMRAEHGQYETGIKTEYDTKLNSALTYAMSKYNGYNLQDVLNELGVSGYYTEIVDEVGKRLSGMDATSLQATTETVLAQDIINNISGFTGSENDLAAAISMYKGMYGKDVIGKAFERAKTIYQNSAVGQDATLNGYVDQYYGNYTGDINTLDLSGIENEGMREKVKTGIQQRFEEEKSNLMSEILKLYPNYTASADEDATIDAMFGNKYGANVLTAAKSTLKNLYQSGEGYQNTQVQSYIDQYYGNYTGDIETLVLDGIEDEGMREKVKKGIEEKFRAQVGKAITAIGNWLNSNGVDYSGTQAQKDALKAALGFEYGTNELEYALSQYDVFGNYAKEEYANSPEGIQATADEYVTTYGASFDPNYKGGMDAFIQKVMKVNTTDKESAEYKAAKAAWEQMSADYDSNIEAATRRAEELYRGATYTVTDENGNKVTKQYVKGVIEKLIKEGYSEAVANAAAQKLIGQDPTIYKERAGKQAYADAMSRLGIEGVDPTKYSSWEAFETAITNSLQGTDWSKDSVNYAIKNAKNAWDDAKRSTVAGIVEYFAEQIKSGISESQIRKELGDAGYSNELIDEGYTTYKNSASKDDLYFNRIDEIVNTEDIREVSLEEMYGLLGKGRSESVEMSADKGGGTFTKAIDDVRLKNHASTMLKKAINNISDLQSAWNLIGYYDQLAWEELNDGEKILKILDAAGRYKKKGLLEQDALNKIYEDWITTEYKNILSIEGDDQRFKMAKELEAQLLTFIDSGYIDRQAVEDIISKIPKK